MDDSTDPAPTPPAPAASSDPPAAAAESAPPPVPESSPPHATSSGDASLDTTDSDDSPPVAQVPAPAPPAAPRRASVATTPPSRSRHASISAAPPTTAPAASPSIPAISTSTPSGATTTVRPPSSPSSTSSQDRQIMGLQKELKKAWALLEAANDRDSANKDLVADLQAKLATANQARSPAQRALVSENTNVLEVLQQRDELARALETERVRLAAVQGDAAELAEKDASNARDRATLLAEIASLKELVALRQEEAETDAAARDRLERDVRDARAVADAKATESKRTAEQLARAQDEVRKLEAVLKDAKDARDKMVAESDLLHAMKLKLEEEVDHHLYTANQLVAENQKLAQEVKLADDDVDRIQTDFKSVAKMREMLQRKLKQVDEMKAVAEQDRDALKSLVYSLERQVESHKKQAETDRKQIDDLIRERDILSKNYLKATSATQKQANLVKLHEQTKQNLEQEIAGYKEEAAKQRKLILALEKERDRYVNEAAQIQQGKQAAEEEVIIKENQIFDYKKKIAEAEYKLKQQQALYEQVRSDRNLYSKNLIESQDEITEMRRKLKIMTHQIEQYKEEISAKESALLKEHFEHLKVEKEKEGAKQELQKLKQQLDAAHQFIQNQQAEENKLRHIIAEADSERLRQKKEYEAVIQERDILGTQLIRRNDELALLYEKIKIQQSTLNKGEIQYRERLEDIRVLKLEVKKLRREKTILQHETTNVETLRNEIYRLQKELLNERTRVKVLEEELENPMNIHRWRKLAGSDPSTYELVQKVQTLQKRLIAKTEQVVEKELLLQAKEKLYLDLKAMLSRVPGPEIVQQVEVLKNLVKDKTRELKAMASELNMHQAQAIEFKADIQTLSRQVQDVKKKYLLAKKAIHQSRMRGGGGGGYAHPHAHATVATNPAAAAARSSGSAGSSALPKLPGHGGHSDRPVGSSVTAAATAGMAAV
ncbi:hypothetical protein AMAG_10700 [Allomyces macrogynus ATCC 38327]|uniref:Cilia- and flagella-associated protein 58 central coiled coil domain-containing protein n=1 Tax=Allomyces macrogynus (strain ATCC 38327) TaxID=578462 RepID=A0A0L0SR84_ALLM3|nr:hypothetical protein AMAG_10700 [Allomyces macrogynus ATCC 38327]|eukprot:KNE65033.1 hypothetical protein AMAG_10700 [Allomyces macrogynus ATCC 38327]